MQRPKRGLFGRSQTDLHRMKEPIDPYTLILENRLDWLRPTLKEVMQLDDPFNYLGTAHRFDMAELHRSFFKTGVLQIVSERSRPNAFQSPSTVENPQDAIPGVVDIKITKVGTLWRKDIKKKRTRSPWQQWGVILTGSQLYFFKNLSWIKDLLHQQEKHRKEGNINNPVVFSPPLLAFKPDSMLSTDNAVALHDGTYKKHKNAFAFVRHGGMLEYFLAEEEEDMNDWIAKLNYAATFKTAGIRMRGAYDVNRSRGVRRLDSSSTGPRPKLTGDGNGGRKMSVDPQLAMEISVARRQLMELKIADAEKKLENTNKQMELLLRNARHLQILAPIQAKAREQVIHSAATLSAKLKWVRMEYWKLQCHRDILALDLSDEKQQASGDESLRTLCASKGPGSPRSSIVRPSTAGSATPTPSHYGTPLEALQPIQSNSSTKNQLDKWEMPRLEITGSGQDGSQSPAPSHRSPVISPTPSPQPDELIVTSTLDSVTVSARPSRELSRPRTPPQTHSPNDSQASFEEAMFDSVNELERRPSEKEKSRNPIPKLRTSLKDTLRDVPIRGHRSKKSKDFSSMPLDGDKKKEDVSADEGLTRTSKNFTVHGSYSLISFPLKLTLLQARRHPLSPLVLNGIA